MKKMRRKLTGGLLTKVLLMFVAGGVCVHANAQELKHDSVPDLTDYVEIYRDTTEYIAPTTIIVQKDSILEPVSVVTNKFGKNWFAFATVGAHTFRGDFSKLGKFSGTVSPEFTIGVGKWFTPGIGLKVEIDRSESKGYTAYEKMHYGYGDPIVGNGNKYGFHMKGSDDLYYKRMKTGWWDFGASAILNLSRLIKGYEGFGNRKMMNQFMLTAGIGLVHHTGYRHDYGSDNELSGRVEFQYSRFFTTAKRWSLDLKFRGIFYQTNFDLDYGQFDHASRKVDCNLGAAAGFTYYLGEKRSNGWGHSTTKLYQRDYRERDVLIVKQKEAGSGKIKQGTMTFYVFYPNNYSGRNDAPIIAGADVYSIDYLAGGLYMQKKYADTGAVTSRLNAGQSLNGLATQDIPTELAENLTFATHVPRGYEMLDSIPLSLSLSPAEMTAFREKEGFYYAPIYDGRHTWQYRIDDATLGQHLLSNANYAETRSFGINAHSGLDILRENMILDTDDELVSFADVYAAINGNEGYISQFADKATVERIKEIFNSGIVSVIQAEGMATSQDNFTGANATQVGEERNNALSENRANSVVKWLQQNENLSGALMQTYIGNGKNFVNTVTDTSTRGLRAKLNRGVKVRIHYMLK